MSAVQNAIERVIEYHEENCNGGFNSPCNLSIDARSELVQLRSDLQAAQERIAEQARQLDEARKLEQYVRGLNDYEIEFTACPVCDYPPIVCECGYVSIRAWLAANPAPQESQTPNGEGRP